MSKQYRQQMGFSRKDEFHKWVSCKDIIIPNWPLVEARNDRLIEVFTKINEQLPIKYEGNIGDDIWRCYNSVKANNLLPKMRNQGRAMEQVYLTWLIGYMAEKVFTPFIVDKLILSGLERNGGDDLSSIDTFKRTGAADLVDSKLNIFIDVQCGTGEGVATIKKHKVDQALKVGGTTYACMFGLFTGTYGIVNLNELKDAEFYKNESWENALCWDVPPDIFKNWYA
jgi:hypothetical protein